jgi:small conductance mechanosensitive channel
MSLIDTNIINLLISSATKIAFAIMIWVVGRWLIGVAIRITQRALQQQKVDATVVKYASSALSFVLTIALVTGLLGYFGIETTSFAALFAAAGVAIGAAWAGLLAHFAAGFFLLIFRPFKVGDVIQAGGVEGVVREIGLFGTTINTGDNVRVLVGNNKIFSDNIVNYSANDWRAIVIKVEIDNGHDPDAVMRLLLNAAASVPNALSDPASSARIADLKAGPVIAVQVNCTNANYGQVASDLNRAIKKALVENNINSPTPTVININR